MKIGAPPSGTEVQRKSIYFGACAGLAAFSAAFLWCATTLPFRLFWYEPVQRLWLLSAKPPTFVAMDFYSRIALSSAVAAVVGVIAVASTRRRLLGDTLLRAVGIWAVGLTLFAMAWFGWTFSHRTIHPPADLGKIESD